MMMVILKLILTGAVAAMPPGPVAVLVLQKTLCHGRKGGLAAGAGSGVVDTAYAAVSMLTVGAVMTFIEKNSSLIMLIGGIIVALVGFFLSRPKTIQKDGNGQSDSASAGKIATFPFQTAACALANPGAIGVMIALVALFRLTPETSGVPFPLMLLSVWCGEMLWWTAFTSVTYKIKEKISDTTIPKISRIAGFVVIALGLVLAVRGGITL